MSDADEARAELLAFAERLAKARGITLADGPARATVEEAPDHPRYPWRAEAHITGCAVRGRWLLGETCDGDAGVWSYGTTPEAAVAGALEAWRARLRYHCAAAEGKALDAATEAARWRRLCAEVGA